MVVIEWRRIMDEYCTCLVSNFGLNRKIKNKLFLKHTVRNGPVNHGEIRYGVPIEKPLLFPMDLFWWLNPKSRLHNSNTVDRTAHFFKITITTETITGAVANLHSASFPLVALIFTRIWCYTIYTFLHLVLFSPSLPSTIVSALIVNIYPHEG